MQIPMAFAVQFRLHYTNPIVSTHAHGNHAPDMNSKTAYSALSPYCTIGASAKSKRNTLLTNSSQSLKYFKAKL